MHELSLMCAVIDAIQEQAIEQSFSHVYRVALEVGQLCNVEVESLIFCFDIVAKGTIAEHASLDIGSVPGEGWCYRCQNAFVASSRIDPCPSCGVSDVTITGGDQLLIKALEVE
jgi:hydrogenase nickel incorporation protein HypA/HybF